MTKDLVSEIPAAAVFISDEGEVRVLPGHAGKAMVQEAWLEPVRNGPLEAAPMVTTTFYRLVPSPSFPGPHKAILRLVAEARERDALLDECYAQLRGLSDAPYQPWPEALCQLFAALQRRHWNQKEPR